MRSTGQRFSLAFVALALSLFAPRAARALEVYTVAGPTALVLRVDSADNSSNPKATPLRCKAPLIKDEAVRDFPAEPPLTAPATSSQLRLIAVESLPAYLQIRLPGTPKNPRSPPPA